MWRLLVDTKEKRKKYRERKQKLCWRSGLILFQTEVIHLIVDIWYFIRVSWYYSTTWSNASSGLELWLCVVVHPGDHCLSRGGYFMSSSCCCLLMGALPPAGFSSLLDDIRHSCRLRSPVVYESIGLVWHVSVPGCTLSVTRQLIVQ